MLRLLRFAFSVSRSACCSSWTSRRAALDPDAEHALYERIEAATRAGRRTGTITILVSHRFSTVRMADLIIVLHRGRIAEIGPHTELIVANGRYAELSNLQARGHTQGPLPSEAPAERSKNPVVTHHGRWHRG